LELTVLSVEALHHAYTPGEIAIADLSFTVGAGAIVAIVGPSGCGKTTLLKALAGLVAPTGGDIRFQGKPVRGVPPGLAMVFQEYGRSLFAWTTVRANVELPLRYQPLNAIERAGRVSHSLEAVGLAGFEHRYPWQLSGGMQQRVAIARALAYQPKLLLRTNRLPPSMRRRAPIWKISQRSCGTASISRSCWLPTTSMKRSTSRTA
jgi:NitT/TauT family transport system ATP-binding protein